LTERLYYYDSYLTEFQAHVVDTSADRKRIYLDRTAFYPTSGGQPFDLGKLGGIPITEIVDEEDRIAHLLSGPLLGTEALCEVDWDRRFDHMQQHTGQHLLSAVFVETLNVPTVSFHLGSEFATIDLGCPSLDGKQLQAVEERANDIVFENRPVSVSFQDSSEELGLRKRSERGGVLRIVSIEDLDRSACGGTHVQATGEIGPILMRKQERVRGNVRIEFLCGTRAVRRARADYEALSRIAGVFSAALDETPDLVAAQFEKAQEVEKARRRLSAELAGAKGRENYSQTAPGPDGTRRSVRRVLSISEDLRIEAQSFTAGPQSVVLVLAQDPPAILLAASKDSGWNAGAWLKSELAKAGGRGGGSPAMAQGSVPSNDALEQIAQAFQAS
jgi:alanyl-tRNA synthetase